MQYIGVRKARPKKPSLKVTKSTIQEIIYVCINISNLRMGGKKNFMKSGMRKP